MPATVLDCIKQVFPVSTQTDDPKDWEQRSRALLEIDQLKRADAPWLIPPWFPTDLFAVSAFLLDTAGAFSYFDPNPDANGVSGAAARFALSYDDRIDCEKTAEKWIRGEKNKKPSGPPGKVIELWRDLITKATAKVRDRYSIENVPDWWNLALRLMIIADETCVDIGKPPNGPEPYFRKVIRDLTITQYGERQSNILADGNAFRANGSERSFAMLSDTDVVNVFPKSRISVSGCSHRNFSRNLAMLPKAGAVRCHWLFQPNGVAEDDDVPVDILIIPYPFTIQARSFRSTPGQSAKDSMPDGTKFKQRPNWCNFDLNQDWLIEEDPALLAESLLRSARKDVDSVNGVVFPEYSLDFETFVSLCERLKKIEPKLEFIVAGTRNNCDPDVVAPSNYVMTAVWHDFDGEQRLMVSSRRKHHRWMLSSAQLESYALTSALDPRVNWWENMYIGQRELHFHPLRKNSLFSAMICEDLARSDPCHEVLRSIAPNLVFVLLLDGAQIPSRWSARYASSLSDDPGSSVLTLTAFGMVDRSNKTRLHPHQEAIAYFSSAFGQTPIYLPYKDGARGVLISLVSQADPRQQTIDGRVSDTSRAWRLASTQPIKPLPSKEKKVTSPINRRPAITKRRPVGQAKG
jgi:hypothetical protein